jgi:hypothetical protein
VTPLTHEALVGSECFGQRATNAAMLQGMALDLKTALGQITLTLDSRLVGELVPVVATETGEVLVSAKSQARFRLGLQRQVSLARLLARKDPNGTQVADGATGAFMGVDANGAFATRQRPAEYFDPPLPWPGNGSSTDAARAQSIALLFRGAHAADFCAREDASVLATLVTRAKDTGLDASTHAAACSACTAVVQNHLRVGNMSTFDTAREPLCRVLSSSAAVLYQSGTSADPIETLARTHCGC